MDDKSISSSDRTENWLERTRFCSAFFSLSEATCLGDTCGLLEGAQRLGYENPSTSSRIPSTFTLVGDSLEDDEPSFEAAVFKGPAEPLGALLEGFAEPLDAILWGLVEPLGFITMAQTNLLKMDRVQNEARRVTLATTKDTPIETIRFMLDFQLTQTRQKVKQVKAYFSAVENPHNTSIKCYPCPPLDFDSGGDTRTTHAIILTDSLSRLQKVKNGMGSLNWSMSMVDIHLRKLLWVYCPGQAGVKGNDGEDRLAGKATLTSVLLLGRSEVLRSLRYNLRAQSQGHHTVDRLEERGVDIGIARRSSLKRQERAIVNPRKVHNVL